MPSTADTASLPVLRLRMAMPRTNSWAIVVVVKAQKPKQITAAHDVCRPTAAQTAIVTTVATSGHMNW